MTRRAFSNWMIGIVGSAVGIMAFFKELLLGDELLTAGEKLAASDKKIPRVNSLCVHSKYLSGPVLCQGQILNVPDWLLFACKRDGGFAGTYMSPISQLREATQAEIDEYFRANFIRPKEGWSWEK